MLSDDAYVALHLSAYNKELLARFDTIQPTEKRKIAAAIRGSLDRNWLTPNGLTFDEYAHVDSQRVRRKKNTAPNITP